MKKNQTVVVTVNKLFSYCKLGDVFIIDKNGGISTHCWKVSKARVERAKRLGYLKEIL